MASVIITSFFTRGGQPATDLETATPGEQYPKLRVWEVIDGVPSDDLYINQFTMGPIESGSPFNDDGFYKYEFTEGDGYDITKHFLFRVDGGPSLSLHERYQVEKSEPPVVPEVVAELVAELVAEDVADAVWDEALSEHTISGSAGLALTAIKNETSNLYVNVTYIKDIIDLIIKYDTNRTRIDVNTKKLYVYDDDCTTVLREFDLLDSVGAPSVISVCERVPVDATDGHAVCP